MSVAPATSPFRTSLRTCSTSFFVSLGGTRRPIHRRAVANEEDRATGVKRLELRRDGPIGFAGHRFQVRVATRRLFGERIVHLAIFADTVAVPEIVVERHHLAELPHDDHHARDVVRTVDFLEVALDVRGEVEGGAVGQRGRVEDGLVLRALKLVDPRHVPRGARRAEAIGW